MRLKVLPLPHPAEFIGEIYDMEQEYHIPVRPRYNRPGLYIWGEQSWVELPDGRAFVWSSGQAKLELETLEVYNSYNQKQIDAIREAIAQRIASKKQHRIAYVYNHALCLQNIGREHMKRSLRRKRFERCNP
jgi:hypothetical protein